MSEPTPIDLPVGLRWVKLVCRLGTLVTDSAADADAYPDLLPVGGTLTLAASPSRVRIQEADGRWRSVEVAGRTYTIRADGELVDNEGRVGVWIPDPASLLVEPQGYAITAVVKPTAGTDWRVTFGGSAVLPDVVDLVAVSSVGSASPSVTASFDARLYALEQGGGVDVSQAVEDYLTANPPAAAPDATTAAKGLVQLAGDLGGAADAPTVPGLADKADATHTHTLTDLDATGTPSATTYLRGDGTWATPAGGSGSTLAQVSALTLPANPEVGESVTVLADSSTTLPAGTITWDAGGEPAIVDRLLISLVWSGSDWVGSYGVPIPAAPAAPDTTAPTWTATFSLGTPSASSVIATASQAATDDTAVAGYEVSYDNGATWAAITPAGLDFELSGLADTTYATTKLRATDAAGNTSAPLSVPSYTLASSSDTTPPTAGTLTASSITESGFTLTVSGATDDTALHAQPYRFSIDNGATWTAWQADATSGAEGKQPETAFTCVHEVRDASGNTAQGNPITVTTAPAVTSTVGGGYLGSVAEATDGTDFTFSAQSLGAPAADREIVVAIASGTTASTVPDPTSVTIAGVSASLVISNRQDAAKSNVSIWRAQVPAGTSGDIVVTHSTSRQHCHVHIYALTNVAAAPAGTMTAQGSSSDPVDLSPAATAPGGMIVAASYNTNTGSTVVLNWTGITLDAHLNAGASYEKNSAAAHGPTSGATHATAVAWGSSFPSTSAVVAFAPVGA